MHETCARFSKYSFSLFSLSLSAPAVSTALAISIVSSLVPVTGVKFAEPDTSFFTPFLDSRETCLSNFPFNGS